MEFDSPGWNGVGVGNALGLAVTSTSVGGGACVGETAVQDVRIARRKMKVRRSGSLIIFFCPALGGVPAADDGGLSSLIGLLKILRHQIRDIGGRIFAEDAEEISSGGTLANELSVVIL